MTWQTLVDDLLEFFPNLEPAYIKMHYGFSDWHPGPYCVFGDIFIKFMLDRENTSETRERIGKFLERMVTSNIENIEDLLTIDVLPALLASQAHIDVLWPHLGEATKRRLDVLAPSVAPNVKLPHEPSPLGPPKLLNGSAA